MQKIHSVKLFRVKRFSKFLIEVNFCPNIYQNLQYLTCSILIPWSIILLNPLILIICVQGWELFCVDGREEAKTYQSFFRSFYSGQNLQCDVEKKQLKIVVQILAPSDLNVKGKIINLLENSRKAKTSGQRKSSSTRHNKHQP